MKSKFTDKAFSSDSFGNTVRDEVLQFQLEHNVARNLKIELREEEGKNRTYFTLFSDAGEQLSSDYFESRGDLEEVILVPERNPETGEHQEPGLWFIFEDDDQKFFCSFESLHEGVVHKGTEEFPYDDEHIYGTKIFNKDQYFNDKVTINEAEVLTTLTVDDTSHLKKDVTIGDDKILLDADDGNVDIKGKLDVVDTAALHDTLTVDGKTALNDELEVIKKATLKDDLEVEKNTQLGGTLDVTDATTLNDALTVEGVTTLNNDLIVADNKSTTLGGTLEVKDSTKLDDTLTVDATTTLHDTLTVDKETNLNDNLTVADSKSTILGGTLEVKDNTTLDKDLHVVENTSIDGTLSVTGSTTLSDTLDVAKATILSDTLEVDGAATLNNTLSVSGATNLHDDLTVDDDKATILGGTLEVKDDATLDSNLEVKQNAVIDGALDVTGATNLHDALTVDDNKASTLGGTLEVKQKATLRDDLEVEKNTVLDGSLSVTGATTLADTLTVEKATNLNDDLTVADNKATILGGTLEVKQKATLDNELEVKENTTLDKDLLVKEDTTVEGNLSVTGTTILADTLSVSGVTTLHNDLIVDDTKSTTLGGTLEVKDDATLDSDLLVNGSATVEGNLSVTGTTVLESKITVNDDADITGNTKLDGSVTIISNEQDEKVSISGPVEIAGNTSITGNTDFKGSVNIAADEQGESISINGPVGIVGNTDIEGDLSVTGALDIHGQIDIEGSVDIIGPLSVSGNTLLDAGPSGTVDIVGLTSITGTLNVSDNTTLNKNLHIVENTDIGGTLSVNGATTLANILSVSGTTTLNDTLTVNADTNINGNTDIKGSVIIIANGDNESVSISGPVSITGKLNITDDIHTNNNLIVDETTTLKKDVIIGNDTVNIDATNGNITAIGKIKSVNNEVDNLIINNYATVPTLENIYATGNVNRVINKEYADTKLNYNVHLEDGQDHLTYSEDKIEEVITYRNLSTGNTNTKTITLKSVTNEKAGLMSKDDFIQLNRNTERIELLEGRTARWLYTDKTDPTADDIQIFVNSQLLRDILVEPTIQATSESHEWANATWYHKVNDVWTLEENKPLWWDLPLQDYSSYYKFDPTNYSGVAVVVDETYHIWHYYQNLAVWKDDGVDTVHPFNSTTNLTGTIKHTNPETDEDSGRYTNAGKIQSDNIDGNASVIGWNELQEDLNKIRKETATLFDSSKVYEVGDRVIRDGILYKCIPETDGDLRIRIEPDEIRGTRWCIGSDGKLDTTTKGAVEKGPIYACFYSVMPTNPDVKKDTDYVGPAWPGAAMSTVNNPDKTFAYAHIEIPNGAVAVCFNSGGESGWANEDSLYRTVVINISELQDGYKTFIINTDNAKPLLPQSRACQTGYWSQDYKWQEINVDEELNLKQDRAELTRTTIKVGLENQLGSVTAGTAASYTQGMFNAGTWYGDVTNDDVLEFTYVAPSHAADNFTANTPTQVTIPSFRDQKVVINVEDIPQ